MTLVDLIRMFAEPIDLAVVLTGPDLERPGPTILYANPAFARMSGYEAADIVTHSPRILQGEGTNQEATRHLVRTLRGGQRFLGCLQNYRRSGEPYLCEIDVRPIHRQDGTVEAFIAFEREVVRRRGRPARDGTRRYRAATPSRTVSFLSSNSPALFV